MKTDVLPPSKLFVVPVRYEIPAFQRPYVWNGKKQWVPLWDDIEQLAESILEDGRSAPDPHFLGAVVLQQMPFATGRMDHRIVVDGQQRLITLQLLIHAIQEVLEDREHTFPAERLMDLVENDERYRNGDSDKAFKVWPTIADRDAFRYAMCTDLSVTARQNSLIVQAHDYFAKQTEGWLDKFPEETGERDRAAVAIEAAVGDNLQIVVIDLDDSEDPHVIFETLNARGTPLLQSDMIKNKILHDANIQVENNGGVSPSRQDLWPFDADKWWRKEKGRGVQHRPLIDLYLNHWLTLRNQTEMKAYDEFRAFVRYAGLRKEAGETIDEVARDIRDVGEFFRDIEEVRRPGIAKFLERRKTMNVGAVTPLLLGLLCSDLPRVTLVNCLRGIESFLVRRVLCGYHAKNYGELFVGLIARLASARADEADKILLSFLEEQTARGTLWPSDEELLESFLSKPLYQWVTPTRLRMVLTGIEEQLRTEQAETPDAPRNLQIEHVMPQAWHANWPLPGNDGEAVAHRERAIHMIGNLTLVNRKLNASLSNAPWDSKREALADHSVLFLNKHLVKEGPRVWDEAAIMERAKWLHEKAIKIWPHRRDIKLT